MARPTPDQAQDDATSSMQANLGHKITDAATLYALSHNYTVLSISIYPSDLGCTSFGGGSTIPAAACANVTAQPFQSYKGVPLTPDTHIDQSKQCTLQFFSDERCSASITDARSTGGYCYAAPAAQQSYQPGQPLFAMASCVGDPPPNPTKPLFPVDNNSIPTKPILSGSNDGPTTSDSAVQG